ELLANRTLRCALSAEAQRLAEPFHLSRTVERYALALHALHRDLAAELRGDGNHNYDDNSSDNNNRGEIGRNGDRSGRGPMAAALRQASRPGEAGVSAGMAGGVRRRGARSNL
ncbi:unnamed protein product, partial [Polarella glacialis]